MTKDPFFERGLPECVEAERSILGSILLENDRYDELATLLQPEAMYLDTHRKIYKAFRRIREQDGNQPIDLITVCDELRRQPGVFEQIGGATYIASLIDGVPRTDTIAPYARLVRDSWRKRKLLTLSSNIQAMVFDDELDADGMQAAAEQYIYELSEEHTSTGGPRQAAAVAARLVDFYEAKIHDRSALIGLSTGFKDIDARTLGLTSGVIVVAARTSHGKTSVLTNIGTNAALAGKSVFMASVESGAEKIAQRILASMSKVDSYIMRQGRMNRDEWGRLHTALERLSITQFMIDDTADMTPDMLISRGRQHKTRYGLDLLLVDHIHEMEPGRPYRTRQEKIGHVMTGLRRASRILDVPVLAAAQLSRASDDRPGFRPQLGDISDSSDIEKVADTVLLLTRKWMYTRDDADKGIALLIPAKNRDGSTEEDVYMAFTDQYTRFDDLAWDDWPKEEGRKRSRRQRAYCGSRTEKEDDDE